MTSARPKRSGPELEGAVALVTGASRGIGKAIAIELARDGADIVALSRSGASLEPLGRELGELGRDFLALQADLSEVDGIAEIARAAWEWKQRVEVLVNCAGVVLRDDALAIAPDQWDAAFALNVRAPFFLAQAVGRRMMDAGAGSIVNITSAAGEVTTRASVAYSASKAALIQVTRVLAVQWAPAVRVNAVGPAYIGTDVNSEWLDDEENRQWVLERTPLGRIGAPEDVAGAVSFLASSRAAYVTGQHLLVDGGWTSQ